MSKGAERGSRTPSYGFTVFMGTTNVIYEDVQLKSHFHSCFGHQRFISWSRWLWGNGVICMRVG